MTRDEIARVLELRQQGMGVNRIAAVVGIGSHRVARIVDDAGLRKEKRGRADAPQEQIISLRNAGGSVASIAKEAGWSESVVHRILRDAGLSSWDAQRAIAQSIADPLQSEILRLYQGERMPVHAVASLLGVRKSRVSKVVQDAGVYRKANYLTDDEKAEILRLRDERFTGPEIAKKLDRSPASVREHLEKHGQNKRLVREIRIEGEVAYVPLTLGMEAMIDVADVFLVAGRNWSTFRPRSAKDLFYATCGGGKEESGRLLMHRVIMGCPAGKVVDHVNHNGLDNRRRNLIVTDHSGNAHNARRHVDAGLPRGVRRARNGRGYYGDITASTPIFPTPEEAAETRRIIIEKLRGVEIRITEKMMPAVCVDPDTGEILDG